MKWLSVAVLALLLCLAPSRVMAQDDQYLRVYIQIQEADNLRSTDQQAPALSRYLEAQAALVRFKQVYPEWNPKVVSYRLNYLAARIAELSGRVSASVVRAANASANTPAANTPATNTPPPAAVADLENQLNVLQGQVRQLQTDKTVLESKLKEALSAQPAILDPRELARAQDQAKALKKENDLLKVNLARQQAKTAPVDARALDQLQRDLAEANRRLAAQTQSAQKLELEKQALQNRLSSLIPAAWNETNIVATRNALADANRKLADQADASAKLTRELAALQARIKTLTADADAAAALRAENEILKKQLAGLKNVPAGDARDLARQLAETKAQVAALQSDKDILRLEKTALEQRLKQLSSNAATGAAVTTSVTPVAVAAADTARIKQLERERDELQKKLEAAQKDLAGRNSQATAARVEELSGQLDVLRSRLAVIEAQQVPYTAEELALFRNPDAALSDAKAARRTVKELPPGAVTLEAEARRDFAERRFDQAEQKYLQVLHQDENNVYTLANLAVVQLQLNRFAEAEKNLKQALALAPDDAYSLSLLGFLKYRQAKYDEALDLLGRAAKLDPQNAEVQNYLGLTLSKKGMRVPAETALRKALELEPNYAEAHYNLAVVYITQKPPATELARLHYKKAVANGVPHDLDLEKLLGADAPPPR